MSVPSAFCRTPGYNSYNEPGIGVDEGTTTVTLARVFAIVEVIDVPCTDHVCGNIGVSISSIVEAAKEGGAFLSGDDGNVNFAQDSGPVSISRMSIAPEQEVSHSTIKKIKQRAQITSLPQ